MLVSLAAGGFVVYLTYEFKTVKRSVVQAWTANVNWKPNTNYLGEIAKSMGYSIFYAVSYIFGIIQLLSLFGEAVKASGSLQTYIFTLYVLIGCIPSAAIFLSVGLGSLALLQHSIRESHLETLVRGRKIAMWFHPLTFMILATDRLIKEKSY